MFEGLRDRRSDRDQEARDAAISAVTSKLARRRMQQAGQPHETASETAETGTAPRAAMATPTVTNQLGMVARHAETVLGPLKAEGAKTVGSKTVEPKNAEHQSMVEAGQTLTVGAGIRLEGEITNCQILIVEGQLDGSAKSSVLQIADGGAFNGEAEIETAVVSGCFEGKLTATQRLEIRSSGRVSGDISYAAIAIEAGGQISGNIQIIESPASASNTTPSEDAPQPETAAADHGPQGGQDSRVEIAS